MKERFLGAACSAISGVYIADFFKKREKADLAFGLVYITLAVAWGVVAERNGSED